LTEDDIKQLRKGLKTKTEKYQPAKVFVLQKDLTRNRTQFELTISEGKNHQVKNMMLALGHEVRRLHRVKFAFLDVKDLRAGEYRRLKPYEIKQLNRLAMEGENK
jgi:23S rRNA pseudouridine2605 synthase